jgi:hypothetical protein
MYIRFVVGTEADHHRSLTGIITEARILRDEGGLNPDQAFWLEEMYEWFNTNLPVPPFSSGAWPRDAVSWFRDDASEAIRKMWEIAVLLTENGIPFAYSGRRILARLSIKIPARSSWRNGKTFERCAPSQTERPAAIPLKRMAESAAKFKFFF